MKPFLEDMMQPLDKLERSWVRRPVGIIIFPLLMVMSTPVAIWYGIKEFCTQLYHQAEAWFREVW
jgi:hypothetical protein